MKNTVKTTESFVLPTLVNFTLQIRSWRPSRVVPSLSIFLPYRPSNTHSMYHNCYYYDHLWLRDQQRQFNYVTLQCDVTMWHRMISWRDILWQVKITIFIEWSKVSQWLAEWSNIDRLTFDQHGNAWLACRLHIVSVGL